MNKLTEMLENKIEWVVLGLGGIYVLYMAYAYLMIQPIPITGIAPEPLPPGEVDQYISETVVADLKQKLIAPPTPQVTMPDFVDAYVAQMSYGDKPAETWPDVIVNIPHLPMLQLDNLAIASNPLIPGGGMTPPPGSGAVNNPQGVVSELPTLTKAMIDKTRSGLTNVQLSSATLTGNQPQQGVPQVDKSWIGFMYRIDAPSITAAWDRSKIPVTNDTTTFLAILVERQELQENGQWSQQVTVVPPLAISQITPLPDENQQVGIKAAYDDWAVQHVADILRPSFYTKVQGDEFTFLDRPNGGQATETAFDPAQHLNDTPAQILALPPQDRQLLTKYKEEHRARGPVRAPGARPAPTPAPRPSRPAAGRDLQAAGIGGRPLTGSSTPTPNGVDYVPGTIDTLPNSIDQAINPAITGTGMGAPTALPPGKYAPKQWIKDNQKDPGVYGWVIDDNVQPGHSYRYRMTYVLKNPVFLAPNVVKELKLSNILSIPSPPSEWSERIDVQSTISFFVTKTTPGKSQITIQVFANQAGQPKTKTFDVMPGDSIGTAEGSVDFHTGWSVVDVRNDPRTEKPYALLLDPQGIIHRRDVESDNNDPRFKALSGKAQVVSTPAGTPTALAR